MGKRSSFARVERDFYPTPRKAVEPLLSLARTSVRFVEPCAGDGRLVRYLEDDGHVCVHACDIEPRAAGIDRCDALEVDWSDASADFDCFITNPPWSRDILHPLIERLSAVKLAWLLFDADWMHTKQSSEYMRRCAMVVSVGRVKWIEGSAGVGKDNCAWYLFTPYERATLFKGR